MKKYLFSSLMIFATANIYSQNFQISFAGTGATTTIDSVKVQNLAKGTSLSLHGTDVLHLWGTSGINNLIENAEMAKVYPSPMQGKAELSFYAKQTGTTQILISDITGKEVLQLSENLIQGSHRYEITGLKEGAYVIKISGEHFQYNLKLISNSSFQNNSSIKYLGTGKTVVFNNTLRSTKAIVDMAFTWGDMMCFTGYSGTYTDIVTEVPAGSKTITFTLGCPSTVTDIDVNTYNTVQIGNQCWMKENLKTTKYRNGNPIPNITDGTAWSNLTTGAYCDYDNLANYGTIYGHLYNFYTVVDSRNPCPTGWHVPSDAEWTTLTTYLGGDSVAGGKLKETGTTHWQSPNTGATNESGFRALPAGYCYDGLFAAIGLNSIWWSSTDDGDGYAWVRNISYSNIKVQGYPGYEPVGWSVRCLKD